MDRSRSGSRQQERQMEIEDNFTMERRNHPYPVSFRKRLSARAEVREEAAMSSSQVPLPADRPAPEHSPSHYRGYVPSLSYHEFRNSHGSSSSSSDSLEHAWSATESLIPGRPDITLSLSREERKEAERRRASPEAYHDKHRGVCSRVGEILQRPQNLGRYQ